MPKEYLGDSVYVDHDGYYLELTTENGLGPSNTIMLEPPVYQALVRYVDGLKRRAPQTTAKDGDDDVLR